MFRSGPSWDGPPEEVLIDEDVRQALDEELLAWDRVTSSEMFGGVSYKVDGRPFAILMEGVVACGLPEEVRPRALTLAGVSPFLAPSDVGEFEDWVQLVLLLPEDLPAVRPWLEAGYAEIASRT